MPGVLGSAAVFKVDSASWKAYVDSVSMQRVRDVLDAASLSAPTDVVMDNEKVTVPLSGKLNSAGFTAVNAVYAAPTVAHTLEFGPVGDTGGYPKLSSSAVYLSKFEFKAGAKGLVDWSGELVVVGGVTPTTY